MPARTFPKAWDGLRLKSTVAMATKMEYC